MRPDASKSQYTTQLDIAKAIKADSALSTLCTTNFGQAQTVYCGFDVQKPPTKDKLPVIGIVLTNSGIDNEFNVPQFSFSVVGSCEISEDSTVVSDVNAFTELEKAYSFADAVHEIVADSFSTTATQDDYCLVSISDIQYDTALPFINFSFNITLGITPA